MCGIDKIGLLYEGNHEHHQVFIVGNSGDSSVDPGNIVSLKFSREYIYKYTFTFVFLQM